MQSLHFVCRSGSDALEPVSSLLSENPKPDCVCPTCRKPVALVQGRLRRYGLPPAEPYARHLRGGAECLDVPMESEAHQRTKRAIRDALRLLRGPPQQVPPPVYVTLHVYGKPVPLPFVAIWGGVEEEVPLVEGSPLRADVGLVIRSPRPRLVLAIEVCDHHPVDPYKVKLFDRLGIPWVEVAAFSGVNPPWNRLGSPEEPIPTLRWGGQGLVAPDLG